MPNTEHINKVIEAIKLEEIAKLNMKEVIDCDDCGTSACIMGFSVLITGNLQFIDREITAINNLGISYNEAQDLFYCFESDHVFLKHITKDMAIEALEELRDTGQFTGWDKYNA